MTQSVHVIYYFVRNDRMFSFDTHRKRINIFYSGLKFSLIKISHSVKFKILFFTKQWYKFTVIWKFIKPTTQGYFLRAQQKIPSLSCNIQKVLQISMYTNNWFLLRFFAHAVSIFETYFVAFISIKFLRRTWMVEGMCALRENT